MLLSIIIPVYCVEHTLQRCVDSILQQSFTDWELILVDDGSTDTCPTLCNKYAQIDKRIKVIHQENKGLSAARNAGIAIAKGKYITFVDSDDYVQADTYAQLMRILATKPQLDMIEYPAELHVGSAKQSTLTFTMCEYHDMITYWLDAQAFCHCYAWNKIYKATLFRHVRYPVGVVFEDVHTLPKLLQQCSSVATVSVGKYYYCTNHKGITATATGKELTHLLKAHVAMLQTPHISGYQRFINYYAHVLNIQLDVYEATGKTPILPLYHFKKNNQLTFKLKLLHLIGLQRLCQLNKFIHKIYRKSH